MVVTVTLGNRQLTLSGSRAAASSRTSDPTAVLPMREANEIAHDAATLRQRLEHDGYLLLRGFLPREEVLGAFGMIARELRERGWLAGEDEGGMVVDESYPHPSAGSLGTYNKGAHGACTHRPPHTRPLAHPVRLTESCPLAAQATKSGTKG